ncbi:MAG: DNA-deoxyinosine glycosylase [Gammaproteobacteria bacterium]|nr:DNA-deoxyinosine glycosylase [Gammaproteobacteria bacterium]
MARVHSFEPIVGRDPRILILGSMPGVMSLQAVEYYANPRNVFWKIIGELFELDTECSYRLRVRKISELPLVLWDTLRACHRSGSLDSSILGQQIEANDIAGLLQQYSSLRAIAFNGAASEKYFNQLVKQNLPANRELALLKMPSTSPANAGMKFEQKLHAWRQLLEYL